LNDQTNLPNYLKTLRFQTLFQHMFIMNLIISKHN